LTLVPQNIPTLLIVWRRPHTLRQVIDAIRPIAPKYLFVACDGPSPDRPGESAKVVATREVIDTEIDWPCQIERLYFDVNQGCSDGPIRAISWFFEQVEEGIILEDDCVPHPDFFSYCASLLECYRHDTRVWCISGNNFQNGLWRGDGSYYFSHVPLIWGWATWKRCWMHYDKSLRSWPSFRDSSLFSSVIHDKCMRFYWSAKWDLSLSNNEVTWWDYQWVYTCMSNGGLSVHPNFNLILNIGTGPDATHTTGNIISTALSDEPAPAICHPSFLISDLSADLYLFDHVFGGIQVRRKRTLLYRLYHRVYRLLLSSSRQLALFRR
jgi:hypothetical protein